MKKILLVANEYTTIVDFRLELLQALKSANYEVYVALPEDVHNKIIRGTGAEVINLEMSRQGTNPIKDLKTIYYIRKILKELKPDVVLTFTIKPNVYAGYLCGLKRIPYISNITGLGTAIESKGKLQKFALWLYRKGLKKASWVYLQNESNLLYLKAHNVLSCKYKRIPGSGVNLNKYTIKDYPEGADCKFVYVGRVMVEKGIEQFIDAAKYFTAKYNNCTFHVCGLCEQGYEKRMQELTDQRILFYHGQVENMVDVYTWANCLVLPTFYPEGLSNVILEASASGRPVITTDKPGCKELVDEAVNGFIVKQRDSYDLIQKIQKFLTMTNEERKVMGIAGRKKIETQYDRQIVVKTYLDDIKQIIERTNHG